MRIRAALAVLCLVTWCAAVSGCVPRPGGDGSGGDAGGGDHDEPVDAGAGTDDDDDDPDAGTRDDDDDDGGDPDAGPGDNDGVDGGVDAGSDDDPGEMCGVPVWSAGTWYVAGDIVWYAGDGLIYIAEHDNPGYDPTISTWYWHPYGDCGGPDDDDPSPPPPPPPGGFASLVSESTFDTMFPDKNPFYSYWDLVAVADADPVFAQAGSVETRKREVAAFLANVAHETGDLVYIEEIAMGEYCSWSTQCPCAPGKRYYGRGPLQISWNFNYCAAGDALGLDLRGNPDLVAADPSVAWRTALWFWTTQTGAGWTTPHAAIVDGHGFGETIRSINGSIECNGGNWDSVQARVDYYLWFCSLLGVSPGDNLYC